MNADSLEAELRYLLRQRRKIDAIKLYRDRRGGSLIDAKNAVEAIEQGGNLPDGAGVANVAAPQDGFEAELLDLVRNGRKLEAVKLYKDRSGVRLMDAKNAVEALQRGEPLPAPTANLHNSQSAAVDDALVAELLPLLRMGDRSEAIRLYQRRTGAGRWQAKQSVAELARRHGIAARELSSLTAALLLAFLGVLLLLAAGGVLLWTRLFV